MERLINSLLDTDLYKITMGQAVYRQYDNYDVGYQFINRANTPFPDGFKNKLEDQINQLAELRVNQDETDYLRQRCGHYLKRGYLDWFANYQFNPDEVKVSQTGGELKVDIEGPWYRTIYWEVPLMALVSELYFSETSQMPIAGWERRAQEKAKTLLDHSVRFADFGTRRRFSHGVQEQVVNILKQNAGRSFIGTSNVDLARRHDLSPVGTFAHEWVMAHAGIFGNKSANKRALEAWKNEYHGNLGIALSDTFTTDTFLKDFSEESSKLYDGARQDSGSPTEWVDKLIRHYQSFTPMIDPLSKTAVFSDGLNIDKVLEIENYCQGRIKTLYGIGTNLTNDVGVTPLNMVVKLRYIKPAGADQKTWVCKISDDPSKASGDPQAIAAAKFDFNIKEAK